MDSKLQERLREFIVYKGMPVSAFERRINASNGFVKNIKNGIGPVKQAVIFREFPELNRVWLLTGEGEMLNQPERAAVNNTVTVGRDNNGSIANGTSHCGSVLYSNGAEMFDEEANALARRSNITRLYRPIVPEQLLHQPSVDIFEFILANKERIPYEPNVAQFCEYTFLSPAPNDCMRPEISRGDIMAVKKMPTKKIINGERYMLDTKSRGAIIGFMTDLGTSFLCRALDPNEFADMRIAKAEVSAVYQIVGSIKKF